MIGTVCDETTHGTSARSSNRECTNTMPISRPSAAPAAKPIAAVLSVYSAAPISEAPSGSPLAMGCVNAAPMSQTCGSERSLTSRQRKGGLCWIERPRPLIRQGSPASHFSSSQPTATRTKTSTTRTARRNRPRGRGRSTATVRRGAAATDPLPAIGLVRDRLVGDVECAVDDLEALGELLLGDREGRVRVDRVVRDHRVEVVPAEEARHRLHLVGRPVERRQGVVGLAAPDEVDDPEQPEAAVNADRGMAPVEVLVVTPHDLAHARGPLEEPVLLVHADRREGGGEADGVRAVRQPAVEHLLFERFRDVMPHPDGAERQVARREPLGHRDEVGNRVPVVDGEPLPGAAEAGHHLVGHHQDPVAVADLADALDVPVRRDEDAVRPDDRLEEYRGDRLRTLVPDHVLETLEALLDGPWLLLTPAVRVRVADDADEPRLVRPAPRVSRQRHRPERRSVVRAVPGEDLVAPGVVTGDLDRILDRLGAAEREEDLVDVARQDLGELLAETP